MRGIAGTLLAVIDDILDFSRAEAGKLALEAGVDMDMQSRIYLDDLPALVRARRISEAVVNSAVRRVLRAKAALGLFEDPYRGTSVERGTATCSM